MEKTGTDTLLERCPRCRYALEGLPVEHRCPECGLPVDRRWRVFGGRAIWHTNIRALVALLLGVFVAGVVLSAALLIAGIRSVIIGWWGPCLFVVGIVILWWLFVVRPPGFVAVGPRGVAVYRGRAGLQEYPWNRIGKAQFHLKSLLSKSVALVIDDWPTAIPGFNVFRGNISEIEACIRCINEYLEARDPSV